MTDPRPHEIRHYLEWSDEGQPTFLRYLGALFAAVFTWRLSEAVLADFFPPPYENPGVGMLILMLPFILGFVSWPLVTRYILRRPSFSVALPTWPPRWSDWFLGVGFGLAIMGVTTAFVLPLSPVTYRGWGLWPKASVVVPFLLVSVVGLFFQAGFEEMYFRGFLEQFTRRYTKSAWLVLALPAIGFASWHIGNISDLGSGWTSGLPYLLLALSLAWVAYRTGSLMMSMGLHYANNLAVALLLSTEGDVVPTLSPFVSMNPTLAGTVATTVVQAVLTVALVESLMRWRARRG